MPDKLSYSEFASKIKTKYPQYESLDDAVLVKKMVDKYPQYNESVDTVGMAGASPKDTNIQTGEPAMTTDQSVAPEPKEQLIREVSREKESLLAGISSPEEKKIISSAFDRTNEQFAGMGGITPYQKIQNFNAQLDGLNKKYDPKSFANMTKEGLDKIENQYKQDARQIAIELGLDVDSSGNVSIPPNEVELFKRKMGDNISFAEKEGKKEVGFFENLASSLASGYERASGAALDLAGVITGLNYFDSYRDLAEGNRYNAETFKQQASKYDQTIQDYVGQGDLTKATGLAITSAVESLPYMIPALVNPEYGVFVMGGMSGIDKYRELDEKKIPEWEKVYNAISTGAFEAIFEKVGTGAILSRSKRAMLEMGEKQGREAIINATTKTIENSASKLGRMPEWAKEGFSEVATGIGQDITDKVTVNPDVAIGSSAVDNFIVGAVMGKAFALPQDVAKFSERKQARDFAKNVLDKLPSDMDIETKINLGWKIAERDKLQEAEDKLDPKFKGKYETQLVTLNTQIDQVANDYLGRAKVEEVPDLSVGKMDEVGDEQSKLDYLKEKGVRVPNGVNMAELNSLYDTERSKEIEADKKTQIEAIETKRQEDLVAVVPKKDVSPEQNKKDKINERADAEIEKVESIAEQQQLKTQQDAEKNGTGVNEGSSEAPLIEGESGSVRVRDDAQRGVEAKEGAIEAQEQEIIDEVLTAKTTEDGKNNAERQRGQGNQEGLLTPEKDVTVQELPTKETPIRHTIESKANALADAIQDKRFYKTMDEMMNLKSDIGGVELLKTAWDGSLNIASEVIRTGGKVAQAVVNAIEHLKGTDWYKGLSDPSKKIAESKLREEIKGRIEDGKQIRAEAKARIRQEKLDAKKTRSKLPSESPVKKVQLSEIAGLKDQLRLEVKAAVESARSVKKSFKESGTEIKGKFKDALDKELVTGGQYRSIINRLSAATTEKTQKELSDYVDRVLDDATYTKEVGIAKKLIKNIQKSNKKGKTKFGDWRVIVDEIGHVRAKNMTIEELVEFNKIAPEILAGETVNIPALDKVYELVKEYHLLTARNDINVSKIKKSKTISEINNAIYELENSVSSTTKSVVGYLKMKHAIDNAAKRAGELFDAGEISQMELDAFNESLYKNSAGIEGASMGFEEELKAVKERILDIIDSERKSIDLKSVSGFLPDTQNLIKDILSAKRADISTLDAKDIDSYLQFVRNLNESAFVPESASLGIKLDKAKLRRTTTDKAASIYSKSKRFAEAVRLKFTNPLEKKLQERSILKSLSSKTKSEEFNLTRTLRSFSDVSAESYLGNFNYADGYTALNAMVGKAFNQSNIFRKSMEDKAVKMVNDFTKFKGTEKQKRKEKQTFAMFMAERRFQANKVEGQPEVSFMDFVYREKSGEIRPKMNDQGAFDNNKKVYESLLAKAKSSGATKISDGREIIDAEKLEAELRKDPRWNKYIDETDNWFAEMEGKVEASTMMNGRTYIKEKKYFPLIQQGMSTFLDTESMKNLVDFNSTGIKMQAGATFAANKIKQQIELDPLTIMHSHLAEITRNYYIFPKLKAAVDAIKASSLSQAELNRKDNTSSGKGDYDNHAEMLGRSFQKSLVSRAAFNLNGRRQTEYRVAERWFDKMLSAKKKGLLSDPTRIPSELLANIERGTIASNIIGSNYNGNEDVYDQMINDWIGERHFSKMADDISEHKFSGWLSSKAENSAIGVITFADTQVGKRVYATEFNRAFKNMSGEKFNASEFRSNPDYETKYEEIIEKANITGLRRTEELFNSKNIMSTPELTRFMGGFFKADAGNFITKIFDSLQGYNRNENEHMIRSARKMKYGNAYEKAQARKDFWAIPISNFTYMAVRSATTVLLTHYINALLGDSDDDKLQKRISEVLDPMANLSKLGSSMVSLSWGGSSNIYGLALKGGMYVLDDSELVNEEGMAKIYEWAQDDLYVSGFKEYTSTKSALTSATPGVTPIKDIWESGEALAALLRATDAALNSGYITREEYLKIANGMNIAIMYGYPNAISGIIQKQMAPMIRNAVSANKQGESNAEGEVDFTNQAYEVLDNYEEFQKEELNFE